MVGLLLIVNVSYSDHTGRKEVDVEHEKKFVWITGEPVVYKNWGSGEPNNFHQHKEYFGMINHPYRGNWNDLEAGPIGGVYEREMKGAVLGDFEWTQWPKSDGGNDHWYAKNSTETDWTSHQNIAKLNGAHLVTITSESENEFVTKLTKRTECWIGLWIPINARFGKKPLPKLPPGGGGYWRTNLIGEVHWISSPLHGAYTTTPTQSTPPQAQGSYTRQGLRYRTPIN